MKRRMMRVAPAAVAASALLLVAACGSDDSDDGNTTGTTGDSTVTISVSNLPSTESPEEREGFLNQVDSFHAKHEGITIEPQETEWDASTFQALVAGGTMPTVMLVPFTEISILMERQQVADITEQFNEFELLSNLNPQLLNNVTDLDGAIRGVPVLAYSMGLVYNRALFTEAGLDPDSPPRTWDEVREAAAQITENTSAQGFQAQTLDNTGGWVLTTTSYGFGSTLQSEDGAEANVDNDATREALEFYQALRWEDDSFGSNFLLNWPDANNAFAGGQVGMFVQGADTYQVMVTSLGMDPEHWGVAPLPQQPNGIGTLGGGSIAVIDPTAPAEEITAALEWIEFMYFEQYIDHDLAVDRAAADAAAGVPVGAPVVRIVGEDDYNQWLEWVDEYINVPRENFALYLDTVDEIPLVPEPARAAQETYAALDPVVQAVLTDQNADIDQLLEDAQTNVQSILDSAG